MVALVPQSVKSVSFGAKCFAPVSIGFEPSVIWTGAAIDPFVVDGAVWQRQMNFPFAQSLWFFNDQYTGTPGDNPCWLFESLVTDWKFLADRSSNGYFPFETAGDQIKFQVTPLFGGATLVGQRIALPFRLYTSNISPIINPVAS